LQQETKKEMEEKAGNGDSSDEEENKNTFSPGTRITVSSKSGTWSSYGTTVLNSDTMGNTVEIKDVEDVEEEEEED